MWNQLAKTATRPADDEAEPPRRKQKGKTDSGLFRRTATALIRRIAPRVMKIAARLSPKAFASAAAAAAMRVSETHGEAALCEPLDAANPYWDFSLDGDAAADFSAARCDPSPGL